MKKFISFLICALVFCFAGCSHVSSSPKAVKMIATVNGGIKIINNKRLMEGGNLLIVPFSAGERVAASDELDRASLMIVKGLAETLSGKLSLEILDANNAGKADMEMKGHVISMKTKRGFFGREQKFLSVKGQVIDCLTGEPVVLFSSHQASAKKGGTFGELGLAIGEEISRGILSGAE